MATDLDELRARLAELKALPLEAMRARVALVGTRSDLEDAAGSIAEDLDVDADVVLLVLEAAWAVRLNEDALDDALPDPVEYRTTIEADVRAVVDALACGADTLPDSVRQEVLDRTLALGKAGKKITPLKDAFVEATTMISS